MKCLLEGKKKSMYKINKLTFSFFEYLKPANCDKYLRNEGLEEEDGYLWKQIGKNLLCTCTLYGVAWL